MAQSDEIDLLDLAVKLNRVFINNLKSLILAFVIGTLAGLAFYEFVPKVYESKIIFSSDVLTFSISKAVVADLKKLVNENNRDELAKKLLIDAPLAKSINDISVETSIEKSENLKEQEKTILILSRNKRTGKTEGAIFSGNPL
jgi:hypothetical protein